VDDERTTAAAFAAAVVARSAPHGLATARTMAVSVARINKQTAAALRLIQVEVAREATGDIDAEATFNLEGVIIIIVHLDMICPAWATAPWSVKFQSVLLNVGIGSGLDFCCNAAAAAHIPVLRLVQSTNGQRILSGNTGVSASQRVNFHFLASHG